MRIKLYTELSTALKIDARRNLLTMSHAHYLDLIGIQRWQLRGSAAPIDTTQQALTYVRSNPAAQWLFILEKQEVDVESPLLQAILAAVGLSLTTVAIAYYDTEQSASDPFELPLLSHIVTMGQEALASLQASRHFKGTEISLIISDNLQMLACNTQSKRQLWQQLKLHRI